MEAIAESGIKKRGRAGAPYSDTMCVYGGHLFHQTGHQPGMITHLILLGVENTHQRLTQDRTAKPIIPHEKSFFPFLTGVTMPTGGKLTDTPSAANDHRNKVYIHTTYVRTSTLTKKLVETSLLTPPLMVNTQQRVLLRSDR